MMKFTSLSVLAFSLISPFAGVTLAADQGGAPPDRAAIGEAIAKSQVRLLAQCPAVPVPANASDLPVQITRWGETGTPVFLVHGGVQGGIGGGADNYAGQKPLSDRGWQLNVIARPGFGQSASRGPDDQNADATLIAERLGTSSHLIGHSFGGAEALLAAAKRPDAVRSLILVEAALQSLLMSDPNSMQKAEVQGGVQRITQAMLSAETPADFAKSFAGGLGIDPGGGPNRSAAELQQHPENAINLGCTLLRARIATPPEVRKAAEIVVAAGIPVLTISGGYAQGQDATAVAVAKILHGQHVVVASPNHFIQQSSPDAFNKTVDDFMRKADATRTAKTK